MPISTPRQRNAVSEGMALGLLLCGHTSIPSRNKVSVDLAFEAAWKSWPHRVTFPYVDNSLAKFGSGRRAITHADELKHTAVLFWESQGAQHNICSREGDWTQDDADDIAHAVSMIDGGVPADGWKALAADFLKRLPTGKD